MSATYSTKTRLKAARAVLDAKTHEEQKSALNHWGVFNPSPLTGWMAGEGEVEYVERLFAHLRLEAVIWYLSHLESRIEELETPNGGKLRDHR